MKKFKLIIVAILFFGFSGFSQDPEHENKTPEEHAKNRSERLAKSLELTDTQKGEIYSITKSHFDETKSKREQIRSLRDELKKAKDECDLKIEAVLDDTQKEKYKEIQEKRKEKHKARCAPKTKSSTDDKE